MRKQAKANVEPVRQRTQYSCMSASMAMCLRALGYEVTEDQVNRVMGAQPMQGAAWEQALACAQHYGCRATLTMPSTVEQLKQWTDAGIPVMIAWNPEGRPWSHASVVFDVDADLNVYIADPNIPNPKETVRVVKENDFYGKWYEQFPNYLVRRPACAIEREVTVDGQQVPPKTLKSASRLRTASRAPFGLSQVASMDSKPKSFWDRVKPVSPFRWATPAPLMGGAVPAPWRVSDKDAALALLKRAFPDTQDFYTDSDSYMPRGHLTIWVGLRDNRNRSLHAQRLQDIYEVLKSMRYPVQMSPQGTHFWLVDDLPKDILRSKSAASPQTAPKTQREKREEQKTVTVPGSKPRDEAAKALSERGGVGQGHHKNKQDYDRGKARRPKHVKPIEKEAASSKARNVVGWYLDNQSELDDWLVRDVHATLRKKFQVSKEQAARILTTLHVWEAGRINQGECLDQIDLILSGDLDTTYHF